VLKNKETCARKFEDALKNRLGRKATFELEIIIKKKQGLKPKFNSFVRGGWRQRAEFE